MLRDGIGTPELDIVPAGSILPHEIEDAGREARIEQRLRADGMLRDPLLVAAVRDLDGLVLLDGTNRRRALAVMEMPWTLVQVIPYADPNAVQLRTWCHAAPDDAATLLRSVAGIPDVVVEPVPPLDSADALRQAGTVAVVLDGERIAAVSLRPGHTHSRAGVLRRFVELYEPRLTRVDCDPDVLEERARQLGRGVLVAFPEFTRSQVVTMATRGLLIPAGITRHIIVSGRALRVNLPLDVLRAPSLEEARAALQAHVAGLHPRTYRETTILFDS